jgi:2-dehydro-3-deoxyphosphooctonate aldolase (KDO 8-P synthase)
MILIAGPCVVEDTYTPLNISNEVNSIALRLDLEFVFKASYKKANRSRGDSFRGIGDKAALAVLASINQPVITDVHTPQEVAKIATFVDWLQVPAFLCRQTELLEEVGKTNLPVVIKKGQFMSPESMIESVNKIGHDNVYVCERGTTFGYHDSIVDVTSLTRMKRLGMKVIMDCTHSVQKPNQTSGITGGDPSLIETMAKYASVMEADGLFFEVHPNPKSAKCDSSSMLQLNKLEGILKRCEAIRNAA